MNQNEPSNKEITEPTEPTDRTDRRRRRTDARAGEGGVRPAHLPHVRGSGVKRRGEPVHASTMARPSRVCQSLPGQAARPDRRNHERAPGRNPVSRGFRRSHSSMRRLRPALTLAPLVIRRITLLPVFAGRSRTPLRP